MSAWSDFRERVRALLFRDSEERQLAEEIDFHLEMQTKLNMERGMTEAEARRRAQMELGGVDQVREDVRAARGTRLIEEIVRDTRVAVRTLLKRPDFALVMLLILGLGIGANTTMFTLVEALLLRQLPVDHPEQLVTLGDPSRVGSVSSGTPQVSIASYPLFRDMSEERTVLSGLYASGRAGRLDLVVSGAGDKSAPDHPSSRFVSGSFFSVLGVPAQLGRLFTADIDRSAEPVVVISHAYWMRRFAGDPSIVGRSATLNGVPVTIIGVAREGFSGDVVGQRVDMWIPLSLQTSLMPERPWLEDRNVSWLVMMGRLSPGTTLSHATEVLRARQARSLRANVTAGDVEPVENMLRESPLAVEPGGRGFSFYRDTYAKALFTLSVAVGLVLLIVCANVSNLMLVRAIGRSREMSVRMAIGAGRAHLIRQMLTESVVLAIGGGLVGLVLAHWGSTALLKLAAGGPNPIPIDTHINTTILAYTFALSLGTALLFGILPALRGTRMNLVTALRSGGRGMSGSGSGARIPAGKLLVIGQVALSVVMLVGTGMLVRSMQRLENRDIGVARDELLLADVDAAKSGYEGQQVDVLMQQIRARLATVPGVRSVSFSENGIFSGSEGGTTLQVEGFTAQSKEDTVISFDRVKDGYFTTVGAHLLAGRDLTPADMTDPRRPAVINETMARFYFPSRSPLGAHITVDSFTHVIVGVVADIEHLGLREDRGRRAYLPLSELAERPNGFTTEIRTSGDISLVQPAVRAALRTIQPEVLLTSYSPLVTLIGESVSQDRLVAKVVTFFGVLAVILTALGLYGVMAYTTSRRTSEFGLRLALGARPLDVTSMMLREALGLLGFGIVVGVPASLLVTRLLRSQVFGIGLIDLPSIVVAVGVLAVSATVAGAVPARRAARSSPLTALGEGG